MPGTAPFKTSSADTANDWVVNSVSFVFTEGVSVNSRVDSSVGIVGIFVAIVGIFGVDVVGVVGAEFLSASRMSIMPVFFPVLP